jgi:serine/threonine protein kinase
VWEVRVGSETLAMKTMNVFQDNENDKQRAMKELEREVGSMRMVSHANVLGLAGVVLDEEDDLCGFLTEVCTGGDLYSYMVKKGGPESFLEPMVIGKQVSCSIQSYRFDPDLMCAQELVVNQQAANSM